MAMAKAHFYATDDAFAEEARDQGRISGQDTAAPIMPLPASGAGAGYDDYVSAEIDYVARSVERNLDRLSRTRSHQGGGYIFVTFSIVLLSWAVAGANASKASPFDGTLMNVIATVAMTALVALYFVELHRRRREIARLSASTARQVEEAKKTMRTLTSWLDRSEIPFRLKRVISMRMATLDALISEATAAASPASRFFE